MEERYRRRYLDILSNEPVRNSFILRSKLLTAVRRFYDSHGYLEVELPILQALAGGATAAVFETHHNALDLDFNLTIAQELYLKKLIVGGFNKVYEVGRRFRNEGIDHTHFPEFTMIEWYEAYADYNRVMDVAEGLMKHLANKLYGATTMKVGDHQIDIGQKWPRIEMSAIIKEKLGLDVEVETVESLLAYAKDKLPDMQILGGETKGQLIFQIFDHTIPKTLIEPTFIIDYPEEVSPLAKQHRAKKGWVERFEGYIGGKEIFDGWSELNDPIVQRERFTNDASAVRQDKEEAQKIDEDFLEAMEYGMPPFGGIGVGIDRLTMFFY
jgi:lysyl-tRNA synthetase class 2